MKEHKKVAFITTIVLLVIFLPFTVLSIIFHKKYIEGNPNHEFHYNNKLWFYDEAGNLIGTYDCNFENCGYAQETIKDSFYGIDYYKAATIEANAFLGNRYAIISDTQNMTNEAIIYDVVNGQKTNPFLGYKLYFIGIQDNYVITINNQGKYGVIQLGEDFKPKIDYQYDFIGLSNAIDVSSKKVKSDKFIVSSDGRWKLIDISNNALSPSFPNPIIDFDDRNIITKSIPQQEGDYVSGGEIYNLYSYDGSQILPGDYASLSIIADNYIGVYTTENIYYIFDSRTNTPVTSEYEVNDFSTINPIVNGTTIELSISGHTVENIEIQ